METLPASIRNCCKEPVNLGLSAFGEASHRLILSLVHIKMQFDWVKPFDFLLRRESLAGAEELRDLLSGYLRLPQTI